MYSFSQEESPARPARAVRCESIFKAHVGEKDDRRSEADCDDRDHVVLRVDWASVRSRSGLHDVYDAVRDMNAPTEQNHVQRARESLRAIAARRVAYSVPPMDIFHRRQNDSPRRHQSGLWKVRTAMRYEALPNGGVFMEGANFPVGPPSDE